jgi:hypothetical protein
MSGILIEFVVVKFKKFQNQKQNALLVIDHTSSSTFLGIGSTT